MSFRQSAKESLEFVFRCLKYHQSGKNGPVGGEENGNQLGPNATALAGATTTRVGGCAGYTNATVGAPSQYQFLALHPQGETTTIVGQMMDEMTVTPGDCQLTIEKPTSRRESKEKSVKLSNHVEILNEPTLENNHFSVGKNMASIDIIVTASQANDNSFITVLNDSDPNCFNDLDGDSNQRVPISSDKTSISSANKKHISVKEAEEDTDNDDFDDELFEFSERFWNQIADKWIDHLNLRQFAQAGFLNDALLILKEAQACAPAFLHSHVSEFVYYYSQRLLFPITF